MRSLQYWLVTMLFWLFIVFNVDRFGEPINIASFVYVLTFLLATTVVVFPLFRRIPLPWLLVLPLSLFVISKILLGYRFDGQSLPLAITEICILLLTTILARYLGQQLDEISNSAIQVMLGHLKNLSRPFEAGQGVMYREVRWARTHQRPLALLAISFTEEALEHSVDHFLEEMQRETIKKYILARLAELLSTELRDCDVLTQRGDHFLALLPEVGPGQVNNYVQKLEHAVQNNLGFSIEIGISTFPEEITFEKLVERAETNVKLAISTKSTNLFKTPVNSSEADFDKTRNEAPVQS